MSTEPWQLLPELTAEEYAALKGDIADQGVLVPVVVDAESGELVEGHHRVRAWTELRAEGVRVPDYPRQIRRFADDDERMAFVLGANLFRRHLTRTQRAEVVTKLRQQGWSFRRIGEAVGTSEGTVRRAIASNDAIALPERVERRGGGTYPARRPRPAPSIVVASARDEARAVRALSSLPDGASGLIGLTRAEERARVAALAERRACEVPPVIGGEGFELRLGDLRGVLGDLADHSVDAIVTDPPYNAEGVPLFEDLGRLAARVLKPGRLAAVYAGHLCLDEEMGVLAPGGLAYMWHGVNILPGRHTKINVRMVNGRHRSVLLYSAGPFRPRSWLHDLAWSPGRGGPEERPLHPWQQGLEPVRHWVRQLSLPGQSRLDPFLGSGTTAVACLLEGRRFIGCDIDPGCIDTTRQRLAELAEPSSETEPDGRDQAGDVSDRLQGVQAPSDDGVVTMLTCPRCGTSFETAARTNTRCRRCKSVVRVPNSTASSSSRPGRAKRRASHPALVGVLLACGHENWLADQNGSGPGDFKPGTTLEEIARRRFTCERVPDMLGCGRPDLAVLEVRWAASKAEWRAMDDTPGGYEDPVGFLTGLRGGAAAVS